MGGFSGGSPVTAWSASDPKAYAETIDIARSLRVNVADYEYYLSIMGRLLYRDDFNETALQWLAVGTGTAAFDTAYCLKGTQSMKLTTAAGAGNTEIARKFLTIAADQGFYPTPLVVLEAYVKPLDNNIRDFQIYVRLDDSVTQYSAAFRYYYQQAGVRQSFIQYLNSAGSFITGATYAIPQPAGNVSDPWHHVVMALNYKQGSYLNYAAIQFDDFSFIPAAPGIPALTGVTNSVRSSNIDFLITSDNASATSAHVDEVRYSDLSGLQNIQVPPY